MKQASEPICPKIVSSKYHVNTDTPSEEEVIYQLEKSSRGAVMLSYYKEKFLVDILNNKAKLLSQAQICDSTMNGSLFKVLSSLILQNQVTVERQASNSDLEVMVDKLLPSLNLI